MSNMIARPGSDNSEDNFGDATEMILINPKTDVLHYTVPIGREGADYYKRLAAESLARKIVDLIEPDYMEQNGFEVLHYRIIMRKYE